MMRVRAGSEGGRGAVEGGNMEPAGPGGAGPRLLSKVCTRIRRREIAKVVDEAFHAAVQSAGIEEIHYIATTGEGEDVPFATGHFYGMTTHARGALYLEPPARAALDVGALHTRAVLMDGR